MQKSDTYSFDNMDRFEGVDFVVPHAITFSQELINGFADLTGDHQWIHTDPERAAVEAPDGSTIAHGMLVLSILANALQPSGVLPPEAENTIFLGLNNIRFRNPVLSGSDCQIRFQLRQVRPWPRQGKQMRLGFQLAALPDGPLCVTGELHLRTQKSQA